jgi:hypothetical protein
MFAAAATSRGSARTASFRRSTMPTVTAATDTAAALSGAATAAAGAGAHAFTLAKTDRSPGSLGDVLGRQSTE